MKRQEQEERLKRKRADSKHLFVENLSQLRYTLRHNKRIKSNISRHLEFGLTNYKSVYDLANEIQELNEKLEEFL